VDRTVAGGTFSKKRKEKRHHGFRLYPYTLGFNWIIICYASRLKIQLFKKKLPKIMGGGGGKHIVLPPLHTHPHPLLPNPCSYALISSRDYFYYRNNLRKFFLYFQTNRKLTFSLITKDNRSAWPKIKSAV
jgi:hypothetical protein